nr:MAG TPA: hypothetical protein [Caudoviricetes sp.]
MFSIKVICIRRDRNIYSYLFLYYLFIFFY